MKNIIAYSMEKLYKDLEEADELFLSSGMKDMELYEKQLAEAARKAAADHTEADGDGEGIRGTVRRGEKSFRYAQRQGAGILLS